MNYTTPLNRLAWPFEQDTYRYSTNVGAADIEVITARGSWGGTILNVDEQYPEVLALRNRIIASEPQRIASFPYMQAAVWDALLFVMHRLAESYPASMSLTQVDDEYIWKNRLLGICQTFRFGDDTSLPVSPLAFFVSQIEEDVFLLAERDGQLFVDAIGSTFAGSWSTTFALGMSFTDIHGPVPRIHGSGMVERSERFLMNMLPGEVFRRTNWSVYDSGDLDASIENAHARDLNRRAFILETGRFEELRMRVEIQHLVRLPMTESLLFLIETQLTPLGDIVTVPEWLTQLNSVISDLPDDMADYKGILPYRTGLLDWLTMHANTDSPTIG